MHFKPLQLLRRLMHPNCPVCDSLLRGDEDTFCATCLAQLPYTMWHGAVGNPMERLFYSNTYRMGRANALLFYNSSDWARQLVTLFKVKRRRDILVTLTELEVQELLPTGFFEGIDAIIPVPLYARRRRQRGYNQAEVIGETVSRMTGIPMRTDLLERVSNNISLARSESHDRRADVSGIFRHNAGNTPTASPHGHKPQPPYRQAHLLLVDDTVTTGSTLCECAATLAPDRSSALRLSFLTLFVSGLPHQGYTEDEIREIRRRKHKS